MSCMLHIHTIVSRPIRLLNNSFAKGLLIIDTVDNTTQRSIVVEEEHKFNEAFK